jgi:nucleoside-diphosphate-sugar epimerase
VNLYVTGATGFVGRYLVAAALAAGHHVRAIVRPSSTTSLPNPSDGKAGTGTLQTVRADLRSPAGLAESLHGADAVIHLAAAKAGDFHTQFAGTVTATENLVEAMTEAGIRQLVGVSTFSVYDYRAFRSGDLVTESSPIDTDPSRRDEYARTKLLQEELYRRFASAGPTKVVIVRPGMVYGRDNLWHALLGAELGPRFLRIGRKARLPLCYVENCADALVLAAEKLHEDPSPVAGETINLIDDDLPTQQRYAEQVAAVIDTPPTVSLPWPVVRLGAEVLQRGNDLLVDGKAKFPGVAVPDRLYARFKPLRYTNAKAKRLLGWSPRFDAATAITRSAGETDPLEAASGG